MRKQMKKAKKNKIKGIRLNKFLASAGLASRRKADEMIQQGRVEVNGEVVTNPAIQIVPGKDRVKVDGEIIRLQTKFVYILLNKPKDVITTVSDERGRKTVLDLINTRVRIYPVGRLDRHTTGALLLTNDGELANRLMHPRYRISKVYHVVIPRKLTEKEKKQLETGIPLGEKITSPAKVEFLGVKPAGFLYQVEIHEGMNRQIRRMFEYLEIPVLKLKRIRYAFLEVKDLPVGHWRKLTRKEIEQLKQMVGLA